MQGQFQKRSSDMNMRSCGERRITRFLSRAPRTFVVAGANQVAPFQNVLCKTRPKKRCVCEAVVEVMQEVNLIIISPRDNILN